VWICLRSDVGGRRRLTRAYLPEVKRGRHHRRAILSGFAQHCSIRATTERSPKESLAAQSSGLRLAATTTAPATNGGGYAVDGRDENAVGHSLASHRELPRLAGVEVRRAELSADRARKDEQLGAAQRIGPVQFWEPLRTAGGGEARVHLAKQATSSSLHHHHRSST
jgi:hypothetical protein